MAISPSTEEAGKPPGQKARGLSHAGIRLRGDYWKLMPVVSMVMT